MVNKTNTQVIKIEISGEMKANSLNNRTFCKALDFIKSYVEQENPGTTVNISTPARPATQSDFDTFAS